MKTMAYCLLILSLLSGAQQGLTIMPSGQTIKAGETLQLTVFNSAGQPINAKWSSSNTAVATVTQSGLVTGRSAGAATIRAQQKNLKGQTSVTVTAVSGGGWQTSSSEPASTSAPASAGPGGN